MVDDTENICVITVDIKGSRVISNRLRLQRELLKVLDAINEEFKDDLLAPFIITLGDECQGAFKSPRRAYDVILRFGKDLHIPFYCGIGLGSLETSRSDKVTHMDGSAFYRSRDALELAKKQTRGMEISIVAISGNNYFDDLLNILFNVCLTIRNNWTDRQRQIAQYLEENPATTYEETAQRFHVTKQAVSKVLKAARWSALKDVERTARSLLKGELIINHPGTVNPPELTSQSQLKKVDKKNR